MDALTELIVGDLRRRNVPVNTSLLAERIARLACQHSTPLEVVGYDGQTIIVKVFDVLQQVAVESGAIVATFPCPLEKLDKPADIQSPVTGTGEGAKAMDRDRTEEEKKARSDRRETLRDAIARAQKEIQHFRDPANSSPPRFEREGDSWSLSL